MSEQGPPDGQTDARFSFGEPCPPIGSWFFPIDPTKEPFRIEDGNEQKDTAQPS